MNDWKFIKENYIDKGIKIFPIQKNGKTPMIERWQDECSCDYFQVLYWYENCKGCNWGIPATQNGLFILDLDIHDPNKNGILNYNKILEMLYSDEEADDIEDCIQKTPSGGEHLIFKTDNELKNVANGSNVFEDYPGIDIRTDGYIVAEPSVINGKKYEFVTLDGCSPKEMSKKLKKFVIENANMKMSENKTPYKKPTNVEVGDRDNQLFSYINNIYYKTRLDYDEIYALATWFNENVLEKPLPERTVRYKVRKIFEKNRGVCIFVRLSDE